MSTAPHLLEAQLARWRELDPELPDAYPLPRGDPIMARIPGGTAVAGLTTHASHPPWSQQSLWSATETFELFPLVGDSPQDGMDALLHAWSARLAELGAPGSDSACLVVWPSRDVRATRVFLDHGMVPLSCLAVRASSPVTAPEQAGAVTLRRAGHADLETVVEFAMLELEYAALVGGSVLRPDAARMKRAAVGLRLYSTTGTAPVWLAEQDGVPIALAECGWVDTTDFGSAQRLRSGRWAYVNCVSVREQARGTGIGGQLMALAHNEFARSGVVGSFLYYNPANPLSSVFWPRQGYRPLWTIWEVRPATALR